MGAMPTHFEISKTDFLLDGKPVRLLCGELHFARIPRPYWKHRLQLLKALGLNTVAVYLFWNRHEPQPGQFDWSGMADAAAFIKLAQEEGFLVCLRPGPYVCAEWEMGGLPWWLLKKKDIRLRSTDPDYLAAVDRYLREVGRVLAPLQIPRGGPIALVQVENELGAYSTDRPYMEAVRASLLAAGFTDVPLTACDWASNFTQNALPGVLSTVNFGNNAEGNVAEFKRKRKTEAPLFVSEYWSGWFDHWGKPHETRPIAGALKDLGWILDNGGSFSLYMTHGGTTFGPWAGAGGPPYDPIVTSYDYNAPLDEAANPTEKYHALRTLLARWQPNNKLLPAIPDPQPVIAVPEFALPERAPLFAHLPKPLPAEQPAAMETYGIGHGAVLYRTSLPAGPEALLTLQGAHDWTQVFLDGKRLGVLDRRRSQSAVRLPAREKPTRLDVLVEAMGRINFGPGIHDRKGLTGEATLDGKPLTGWEVFPLPWGEQPLPKLRFSTSAPTDGPAFHRGSFSLSQTGDTYLDLRGFQKGMVWVNGNALGRFWRIGPQQTLYCPGCWLKKGKNEVIVLDLEPPTKPTVSGRTTPILDEVVVDTSLRHRKPGQNLRLEGLTPTQTGAFRNTTEWQEARFAQPVKGRYLCLEALSAHDNSVYTTLTELELLGEGGKLLPRSAWRVVYADSEELTGENGSADNVFDLQPVTFWHTAWSSNKTAHPHQLVLDLGSEQTVLGLRCLARQDNDHGRIKDFRIFLQPTPFPAI